MSFLWVAVVMGGEEWWKRCWRRVSKGTEEGDEDWGGRGGSGSVVEVNFKDGFGNGFVGLFVGMGGTGLLGKRAPSITDWERTGFWILERWVLLFFYTSFFFFFFLIWWCIINKYKWIFDFLLHILRVGKWLLGLVEFLLMGVFVVCPSLVALHYDCGGGKMKWAVKKMKWNESEAGRQTELLDLVLRYGSYRKYKKLSYEKLETVYQTCQL